MPVQLMVLVELPDGYHQYLPICTYQSEWSPPTIREFDNRKEALDWAEFCLPEHLRLHHKD